MMALQVPVVGQDPGRRNAEGGRAQRMRRAAEEHGREANSLAEQGPAELQIKIACFQLDARRAGDLGSGAERDDVVAAVGHKLDDLADHAQSQLVLARPEAHHDGLRILAE